MVEPEPVKSHYQKPSKKSVSKRLQNSATVSTPKYTGPGTHLKRLLSELGVTERICGCNEYAAKMDRWGVEECRMRRLEIIDHLKTAATWRDKITVAVGAIKTGATWLNPLDAAGSLLDEACRRAENNPETKWLRSISIIITARNYGHFLPDAIESALAQTIPCEVVYSDDFSTDDSLEIARRYPIKVVAAKSHGGVCIARNAGVKASTGELLIHLDGDDKLPPTYAADHLAAFVPGTPFVYGAAKTFGEGPRSNIFWGVKPWHEADIWRGNCVNTSAMYARWAFDKAGGWRDGPGSMWDYDLALRAAKLGWPVNSKAVLDYRQHGQSVSHQNGEANNEESRMVTAAAVRRLNAELTIGTIWSGRLPEMAEQWLGQIAESIRGLPTKPNLIILDHSHNAEKRSLLDRAIERFGGQFDGVTIEDWGKPLEWKTELERRDKVAELLAGACNRLKSLSRDLLWIVEDDIFVPTDAAVKLWESITANCGPWELPYAVTGWYRSRHGGKPHYLAGSIKADRFTHETEQSETTVKVDWAGCGCLMLWRDRTPEFGSHAGKVAAHDWNFSQAVKSVGGKILAVPVACGHAVGVGEMV